MNKLPILLILVGFFSCTLFEESDYSKADFNSEKWKKYSDGTMENKRYEMINDLFDNYLYKGMDISEVENLLGSPDYDYEGSYVYYIGWPPNSGSYFRIDGDILAIDYKNLKVTKYDYGES